MSAEVIRAIGEYVVEPLCMAAILYWLFKS